jgi:hypothetical protein
MVAILFARNDSNYKALPGVDVWDKTMDARRWPGGSQVVAHPPCRAWGNLKHLAKPLPHEKDLAIFAVQMVRKFSGVLEHPSGSQLWDAMMIPSADMFGDEFGGYTIEIDQWDFGHVAHKPTKIYVCGLDYGLLPQLPPKRYGKPAKSITGQVFGTVRCTDKEREYTPMPLAIWMVEVARLCKPYN